MNKVLSVSFANERILYFVGAENAYPGNILMFYVRCKWPCFVDLWIEKIL